MPCMSEMAVRARYSGLIGQRVGRLTITDRPFVNTGGRWVVQCDCDCGGQIKVAPKFLKSGHTASCGCLRKLPYAKTHGQSGTKMYWVWAAMLDRCNNPKNKNFKHYGGRGIKVCDRWQNDYAAFASDMGEKPTPKHSLDRKNNYGDYTPENCRWATQKEQMANTRKYHKKEAEMARKKSGGKRIYGMLISDEEINERLGERAIEFITTLDMDPGTRAYIPFYKGQRFRPNVERALSAFTANDQT